MFKTRYICTQPRTTARVWVCTACRDAKADSLERDWDWGLRAAAQGSQYHTVYVIADCVDFMARGAYGSPADLYRWGYTALTRAVAQCYIVGKSKHGGW